MARYFGGFRDRLKKKARNLSINEKDIEWLNVATSFSWSPARREYQWLEPEDYLSSFLNSSLPNEANEDGHDTGSSSRSEGYSDIHVPTFENGHDGQDVTLEQDASDYIPAYDFNSTSGEEPVHGIPSDILADLPHIDEYKLEISSALQRRGIHVDVDSIQVPDELAYHLNNYHEKGRSSLDSYELRARLQYFKKQVIESYEQLSAPPGGFQAFEEPASMESMDQPDQADKNGFIDMDEEEKLIVSSLDRLEASLREDEQEPGDAPTDLTDEEPPREANSGDSYSASFSNPPSSFADDSWLVLPIDTPTPSHHESLLPPEIEHRDNEDEIFTRPKKESPSKNTSDETKKRTPLFKSSKSADTSEVLKALDSMSTKAMPKHDESTKEEPAEPLSKSPESALLPNSDFDEKKQEFSLFNRAEKTDNQNSTRERKLFDSKRKSGKEQRKEVKLPEIPKREAKETPPKPTPPVEFRTEVKLPGEHRTEVLLPGQDKKEPNSEELHRSELLPEIQPSDSESTMPMDFGGDKLPEDEVSLSELLLKLRNDSDVGSVPPDPPEIPVKEKADKPDKTEPNTLHSLGNPDILYVDPLETMTAPPQMEEDITEPLVDPLEALAKPKKTYTLDPFLRSEDVIEPPAEKELPIEGLPLPGPERITEAKHSPIEEKEKPVEFSDENEFQNASGPIGVDAAEVGATPEPVQELDLDDEAALPNETMAERRARYIEEERKKLYSLIGRLEQSTVDSQPQEDVHPVGQPIELSASIVKPLEEEAFDTSSIKGVLQEDALQEDVLQGEDVQEGVVQKML